jgi:hypothetical protein
MGGVKQVIVTGERGRYSSIYLIGKVVVYLTAIAQHILEANEEVNKSSEECHPLFDLILIW